MGQPKIPPISPLPDAPSARHLGDIARSDARWSVYFEAQQRGNTMAGRVHFLSGTRRRATGWIFIDWTERGLLERFNEFTPVELWKILESLA